MERSPPKRTDQCQSVDRGVAGTPVKPTCRGGGRNMRQHDGGNQGVIHGVEHPKTLRTSHAHSVLRDSGPVQWRGDSVQWGDVSVRLTLVSGVGSTPAQGILR